MAARQVTQLPDALPAVEVARRLRNRLYAAVTVDRLIPSAVASSRSAGTRVSSGEPAVEDERAHRRRELALGRAPVPPAASSPARRPGA